MRGVDTPIEDFQRAYDDHIGNVINAEKFGFDGWTWPEHHFHPASLSPSPHLMAATIAAKTTKLRLSILGSVLSLHDGRRHAEEVGMLDYLSHGRFEPGIAPGAGDVEPVKAGVDPAEIRPRYYSAAEFLRRAIGSRTVTLDDGFSKVKDLQMVPPLRPELASKFWVTAMSPDSAAWAAERGHKLVTGWTPAPVAAKLADAYRAAADAAGNRSDPSMLGIRRRVFVADSDAEAQEKYEQSVDIIKKVAKGGLEMADPKILAMMMHPDDFAMGSPETVADKLVAQCELGGYGNVMAFIDFAGFKQEDVARSIELIGSKVGPRLKSAIGKGSKH